MTVETERASDGHLTFRLGPVERWVVAVCAAALVAGGYKAYSGITDAIAVQTVRMNEQAKGQQDIVTQMAVMNANYSAIIQQLADVPGLSTRVTAIETKQADLLRRQDHDEALRESPTSKSLKEWRR
jgi:hypothetical protein